MTHIVHSSDTVKDCAPTVVHALVTLLAAICRLHSVADVADAARSWARLCEALVSVHLKAFVKQVDAFLPHRPALRFHPLLMHFYGSTSQLPSKLGCDCALRCSFQCSYCSLLRAESWPS